MAAALLASTAVVLPASATPQSQPDRHRSDPVLLFAADGLRQDIVERYAADRRVPAFADMLRRGRPPTVAAC